MKRKFITIDEAVKANGDLTQFYYEKEDRK